MRLRTKLRGSTFNKPIKDHQRGQLVHRASLVIGVWAGESGQLVVGLAQVERGRADEVNRQLRPQVGLKQLDQVEVLGLPVLIYIDGYLGPWALPPAH